jgi:hypothetical protein
MLIAPSGRLRRLIDRFANAYIRAAAADVAGLGGIGLVASSAAADMICPD